MAEDRMLEQASRRAEAARSRAQTMNTAVLSTILGLALLITAAGFRGGSVAWMSAAVVQCILVGSWSGVMSSGDRWARGPFLWVLGMEVHRVWFRVAVDLYLALLLALPFTTVFDGWVSEPW